MGDDPGPSRRPTSSRGSHRREMGGPGSERGRGEGGRVREERGNHASAQGGGQPRPGNAAPLGAGEGRSGPPRVSGGNQPPDASGLGLRAAAETCCLGRRVCGDPSVQQQELRTLHGGEEPEALQKNKTDPVLLNRYRVGRTREGHGSRGEGHTARSCSEPGQGGLRRPHPPGRH